MTRTIIALTAVLALPAFASARSDTDYPHRDWGQVAMLDMSLSEATACIAREMNRKGITTILPVEGGNDIDFAMNTWPKSEPWQTFKLRQVAGGTSMQIFYRHPITQKRLGSLVERLQKHCLKVRSVAEQSIR